MPETNRSRFERFTAVSASIMKAKLKDRLGSARHISRMISKTLCLRKLLYTRVSSFVRAARSVFCCWASAAAAAATMAAALRAGTVAREAVDDTFVASGCPRAFSLKFKSSRPEATVLERLSPCSQWSDASCDLLIPAATQKRASSPALRIHELRSEDTTSSVATSGVTVTRRWASQVGCTGVCNALLAAPSCMGERGTSQARGLTDPVGDPATAGSVDGPRGSTVDAALPLEASRAVAGGHCCPPRVSRSRAYRAYRAKWVSQAPHNYIRGWYH